MRKFTKEEVFEKDTEIERAEASSSMSPCECQRDVHNVSMHKKVFEVDHDGKLRLVEIGETVGCNCTFASRKDICLHVVWVMMNILHVKEDDDTLHQKVHSKDMVSHLLKRFNDTSNDPCGRPKSTVHTNSTTVQNNGNQLNRPLPPTSTITVQNNDNQLNRPLPPTSTITADHPSRNVTQHGFRQPWHNDNPFVIVNLSSRVKKCAG
jgi:hypothetical protein